MARFKTFVADGSIPNGRLYAGDLNGIQDFLARQADFTQTIDLANLRIGDSSLQISKFGSGEMQLAGGMVRIPTGLLKALKGICPGPFTNATRDAIPAGQAPEGTLIYNEQTHELQVNVGSDVSRDWYRLDVTDV